MLEKGFLMSKATKKMGNYMVLFLKFCGNQNSFDIKKKIVILVP
jgi:hypothetical protein